MNNINKMEDMSLEDDEYNFPYNNYLRLLNTIHSLENSVRFTEDWYEEHKRHILKYREIFSNYALINEDITDPVFRKLADETETLLSNLVHDIKIRNTFSLKIYLLLNKHLKELCDLIYGEDELMNLLNELSI